MPPISRRTWKYLGVAIIAVGLVSAAYTPARQFHRFFLTACAETGPVPETELEISAQPVDLTSFYVNLRAAAAGLPMQQVEVVSYQGQEWPIYLIGADPVPADASTLVVAGVHGNEVSGSLAAVDILVAMHVRPQGAPPIHVLAPRTPSALRTRRATTRKGVT